MDNDGIPDGCDWLNQTVRIYGIFDHSTISVHALINSHEASVVNAIPTPNVVVIDLHRESFNTFFPDDVIIVILTHPSGQTATTNFNVVYS